MAGSRPNPTSRHPTKRVVPPSTSFASHATARIGADARGAVFVEKLIVYLPLLLTFFLTWELAELTAAKLVLSRATSAAGRAAVVVLSDDPAYYDGEAVGSFSGERREDIELAAGMILSAIPRFTQDFQVDVSEPPSEGFGVIDVSIEAQYDCGTISMFCADGGALALSETSQHVYQGAKYQFTLPGDAIGGGDAALSNTGGGFRAKGKDKDKGKGKVCYTPCADYPSASRPPPASTPPTYQKCKTYSDAELEQATAGIPPMVDPEQGTKIKGPNTAYGSDDLSKEALEYRCKHDVPPSKNIAVVSFRCQKGDGPPYFDTATAASIDSEPENWQHSEQVAMAEYEKKAKAKGYDIAKDCKPLYLYTERDSCYNSGGASCNDWFANGGQGQTKSPDLETPPELIKLLGKNVQWHFPYNNNYKRFDVGRCAPSLIGKQSAPVKAMCKKLEDGEKACKEVGIKWDADKEAKPKCTQAEGKITWRPENSADLKSRQQEYEADQKRYEKEREAFADWNRQGGAGSGKPPPCKPNQKPKPPYKDDDLEPTKANITKAEKCLEALSLAEAFSKNVKMEARDVIEKEMAAKCKGKGKPSPGDNGEGSSKGKKK